VDKRKKEIGGEVLLVVDQGNKWIELAFDTVDNKPTVVGVVRTGKIAGSVEFELVANKTVVVVDACVVNDNCKVVVVVVVVGSKLLLVQTMKNEKLMLLWYFLRPKKNPKRRR
jgi:hypothetical protein